MAGFGGGEGGLSPLFYSLFSICLCNQRVQRKEKSSNEIKISLRSKNYVDVSKVAKVFNGGGHVRAAGLTVFNETIENATKMVVAETLKYI